jgi:muramoyltetrapeptide carboxypeptidase
MKAFRRIAVLVLPLFLAMVLVVTAKDGDGWHKGKAVQRGGTIGIVAPATHGDDLPVQAYIDVLHHLGYKTKVGPHAMERYGYFAGTDAERADDVNAFFFDDSVDAILCLNGGYGSARILDYLDYDMIRRHPKQLIGFSDITALETALYEKAHIATVYGPLLITLSEGDTYSMDQFTRGLAATEPIGKVALPKGRHLETLVEGTAEGPLAGGNLSVLCSLVGTPYELNGTGAILILEDVGEQSYRIDRMMNQLWQSGLLKRVSAICYGDFIDCPHDAGDFTTDEVLRYYARLAGKPAIKGLPIGHGIDKAYIPFGEWGRVEAGKDDAALYIGRRQ